MSQLAILLWLANIVEKSFERDAISPDHADLLLHTFHGADVVSQPFALNGFPSGGGEFFEQSIHRALRGQGAIKI